MIVYFFQPLHEAARAGYTDVVKLLVQNKADINACTGHGNDLGYSPLEIAREALGNDHTVVSYLLSIGAGPCSEEL
jgi:ankyrin repeat protein